MRILFWSELFWPYIGGAEVVGAKLLPALQARGYEVAVVTSHDHLELPDEDRYNGIPIYRFPFRTALAEGNITQLVKARHRLAELNIYRDMGDHLALDPPVPGLGDTPWKDPKDSSE